MDRTDSINYNGSTDRLDVTTSGSKLDRAEEAVARSVQRFENAMEALANRVEESSRRVQHTVELANKSKDDLLRIKDTAVGAVQPYRDYFNSAVRTSSQLTTRVRGNPRPYLLGAIAVFSALYVFNLWQKRSRASSFRASTVDTVPTDVYVDRTDVNYTIEPGIV